MAQLLKHGLEAVKTPEQRFDLRRLEVITTELFNLGLHAVRHFAQAQGTGQTCTALERVQRAQYLDARAIVARASGPLAQRATQLGQQLGRFFLENREQVGVNRVDRVDVVIGRFGLDQPIHGDGGRCYEISSV